MAASNTRNRKAWRSRRQRTRGERGRLKMSLTSLPRPARTRSRTWRGILTDTKAIFAMSTVERWRFYLPLILTIVLTTGSSFVVLKTDLAVVKHDVQGIKESQGGFQPSAVAELQHKNMALESKVLEQKVDQLRAEFEAHVRRTEKSSDEK